MGWENLLVYMFSSLFTQNKVVKGLHFKTALEKDKSNPVIVSEIGPFPTIRAAQDLWIIPDMRKKNSLIKLEKIKHGTTV